MARAMVAAFVAGGKAKPVLPAGRRPDVEALLTRLMVNDGMFDAYCAAVAAEREEREVDRLLDELPDQEIRELEVAANGFAGLTDDELADLATSAEALEALAEQLHDNPDLDAVVGPWFFEAVAAERRGRAAGTQADARHGQEGGQRSSLADTQKHETPNHDDPTIEGLRETLRDLFAELFSAEQNRPHPRAATDETYHRLYGDTPLGTEHRRAFYELASEEVRRYIVNRARRANAADPSARQAETVAEAASASMTLPMAAQQPEHVLKLDRRLDDLLAENEYLARVYSLAEFAGRSRDEIAELMGQTADEVTVAYEVAKTELTLGN